MYKDKKILAVIIARANSKGLKNKNLKILINKPLVMWPIHAALGSKYIDKVLLSTDSMKIVNKVKKRVHEKTGVNLELEIKIVGE